MANRLAEIQEAIDRFQMDQARELIAEELDENPSADAYYLASQAALSHGKRIEYLQLALDLDPDFRPASDELTGLLPEPAKELQAAAPVVEPEAAPQQVRLASVRKRWLAVIVDGLIVAVLTLMLVGVNGAFGTMEAALLSDDAAMVSAAGSQFQNEVLTMNLLVSAIYNVAFMTIFNGQTLGKIMLKLRVIKKNGQRASASWTPSYATSSGIRLAACSSWDTSGLRSTERIRHGTINWRVQSSLTSGPMR